jgi:uncharacterized membrane protein YtjA (UPF0391 family)
MRGRPGDGQMAGIAGIAPPRRIAMLKWALVFALVSLVAGLLGFTGLAAGAAAIAKTLFVVFAALFLLFLVLGATVFRKITD